MSKKTVILIILIAVLVLHIGVGWVRDNYKLGQDMYDAAVDLAIQSTLLADELDYLQKEFNKAGSENERVYTFVLPNITARFGFGSGGTDVPIRDDAIREYYKRIDKLFGSWTDEQVKKKFTDEKKSAEVSSFKAALRILEDHLYSFIERYNQMSFLEKCFTSWSNERDILSEAVKLPQ